MQGHRQKISRHSRHQARPCPSPNTSSFRLVPTADDRSNDEQAVKTLESEYNVDYASCIGSLIYLSMTRCDTVFAINKLAKYSKCPGRNHFEALFHLFRYLRDHTSYRLRFYSDFSLSPISKMPRDEDLTQTHLFFSFSYSLWEDNVDNGNK